MPTKSVTNVVRSICRAGESAISGGNMPHLLWAICDSTVDAAKRLPDAERLRGSHVAGIVIRDPAPMFSKYVNLLLANKKRRLFETSPVAAQLAEQISQRKRRTIFLHISSYTTAAFESFIGFVTSARAERHAA